MTSDKSNTSPTFKGLAVIWLVTAALLAGIWLARAGLPLVAKPATFASTHLEVSSQTLKPQADNNITIKALGSPPALNESEMASISIPAIGYQSEVPAKELYAKGLKVDLPHSKEGIATMMVRSREVRASLPLIFAAPNTPENSVARIWSLARGKPSLGSNGHFEVPITLQLETSNANKFVPLMADKDYVFTLTNVTEGKELGQLNMVAGNAVSQQIWVPIDPSHERQLVASSTDNAKTNPLTVSWDLVAADLSISVKPEKLETFATYLTRAKVDICLTYDGRMIPSPYEIAIVAASPATVAIIPPSPIKLNADSQLTDVELVSTTLLTKTGTVSFSDPQTGTSASVQISFVSPWAYYVIAMLAGPFGSLAAERRNLSAMTAKAIALLAFWGAISGFMTYLAALAGWSVVSESVVILVGVPSAILVGFAGGASIDTVLSKITGGFLIR